LSAPRQRLSFLVGPTASGKTTVGVAVAQRTGAEVLSLDSMALYRGMDIGTAKPTLAERAGVPHHLIDVADVHEAFSAGRYVEAADRAVADIAARGPRPLFVGGTALYLKALTEGFFDGPPADWELRNRLLAEAEQAGSAALHARLRTVDAQAADRIHPNDVRRIVRALEVYQATGRTISEQQTQFGAPSPRYDCVLAGLRWPREELYERIHLRVDAMFDTGLVDEVRGLLDSPQGVGHAASQFVGYKEVIAAIRGEHTFDEARDLIKTRTRQFARRQLTWFRKFTDIAWVDAPGRTVDELAHAVADALRLAE